MHSDSTTSSTGWLGHLSIYCNWLLINTIAPKCSGTPPSLKGTQSQVASQVITSHSSSAPALCFSTLSFASNSMLSNPPVLAHLPVHYTSFQLPQCVFYLSSTISPAWPNLSQCTWLVGLCCKSSIKHKAQNGPNQKLYTSFDAALLCAWQHIASAP